MAAESQARTDSTHRLRVLGVCGRSPLSLLPSSCLSPWVLQCECGVKSYDWENSSETQPCALWNACLFFQPPPPTPPPPPPPPSPGPFAPPSLGQSHELLTPTAGCWSKKPQSQLGVSEVRISLLNRKERWASNFSAICNNPQNEAKLSFLREQETPDNVPWISISTEIDVSVEFIVSSIS